MAHRDDLLPKLSTRDVVSTFFGVLGPLACVLFAFAYYGVDAEATRELYVLKDYAYGVVIGGGVLVFAILIPRASWSDLGFRRCDPDWLVRGGLIALVLYCLHVASEKLRLVFTFDILEPRTSDGIIMWGGNHVLGALLAVVILFVTPVVTEVFLRGVLFGWLRRNLDFTLSALASSIIFGVVHIEILKYLAIMAFGLLASWLYERSGSLWPPIALHMGFNGLYVVQLILGGVHLP